MKWTKRLNVMRDMVPCEQAPHLTFGKFYWTLCLGTTQIMWRRRPL